MTGNSPAQQAFQSLEQHVSQHIIGQEVLVERLLIALLADGHLLVEGAPGLAKTRAIKILSEGIEADFHRVQFTPDLVLADEVNRAPAKVQSALLEAMAERQITVGTTTYPLPTLFLVMATQNPIEQEGTYPLPEAQLDCFLLHVKVDYPKAEAERQILQLARVEAAQQLRKTAPPVTRLSQETLRAARQEVLEVFMADNLERYLVEIILATRNPSSYSTDLGSWVQWGASPRATIALDRCARAHAWLAGRTYVGPEDIQALAFDVLRHRVLLSYEAEADGHTPDHFIEKLIDLIPVP